MAAPSTNDGIPESDIVYEDTAYANVADACVNNGRNGARAAIGVVWFWDHTLSFSEPVLGRQTNQRAAIVSATRAIEVAIEVGYGKAKVYSSSRYVINGATKYKKVWVENGYQNTKGQRIQNFVDFVKLHALMNHIQVDWEFVPARTRDPCALDARRLAQQQLADRFQQRTFYPTNSPRRRARY